MVCVLAVSLLLSATDVTPPPMISSAPRTAALIEPELQALEVQYRAVQKPLPWSTALVIGIGGGAALAGLGLICIAISVATVSGTISLGGAALLAIGFVLLITAPFAAVAGIITAIVFAAVNPDRALKADELKRQYETKRLELERAKELERQGGGLTLSVVTRPVFTF